MQELQISIGEPFASPTWGSNFAVFSSESGAPIGEEHTKGYLAKACYYAKKYKTYLVPERFMMMGSQAMTLIDPDGKVLGAQQGIFENPSFPVTKRGEEALVWETPFGGVSLCVDVDIYRPMVPRLAVQQGAQVLISSQHLSKGQYSNHLVVAGVWNAAQSNRLIVVGVCNRFNCIAAPKEMTKHMDGFLVSPTLRMPISEEVLLSALKELPARPLLSQQFYLNHKEQLLFLEEKEFS